MDWICKKCGVSFNEHGENIDGLCPFCFGESNLKQLIKNNSNCVKPQLDAGWRDAEKELPENMKDVLVCNIKNGYIGITHQTRGLWFSAGYQSDITHWMELPTPPTCV